MHMQVFEQLGLTSGLLSDQVAVVTGGGRGIGYETACALAALGARVIIAELAETGQDAASAIQAAGGTALWVQADVSDPASVTQLAQRTREAFGSADILVNNAIISPVVSVLDMDVSQWDQVIAINLHGTFLMCKAFLPDMLAHQKGVIVNMVSTDAMPGMAAYIASKQGIVGLSQSLALEINGQGVHVVAFAPGMVDTPGIREVAVGLAPRLDMAKETFLSATLHPAYENRLMPAEDAGAATAYLIAKLADEYHGEVINGYEVLERAGYLHTPEVVPASEYAKRTEDSPTGGISTPQIIPLIEQMQHILEETAKEFERLPIFARPLARRGFKNKSGQSLQMWAQTLDTLYTRVQAQDTTWLKAEKPRLQAPLQGLARYYRDVPQETARFTRDPDTLREVRRIAEAREAAAQQLAAALGL